MGFGGGGCDGAEIVAAAMIVSILQIVMIREEGIYHNGQVPDTFKSQGSIHAG